MSAAAPPPKPEVKRALKKTSMLVQQYSSEINAMPAAPMTPEAIKELGSSIARRVSDSGMFRMQKEELRRKTRCLKHKAEAAPEPELAPEPEPMPEPEEEVRVERQTA